MDGLEHQIIRFACIAWSPGLETLLALVRFQEVCEVELRLQWLHVTAVCGHADLDTIL